MKIPVFSFKTLGCRLNQAEEERLRRKVLEAGFFISEPAHADFCVVNTCSVTAMADKKSHQAIKQLKAQCPKLKAIIVTGCGAELAKDYPEVSLWIPNEQKEKAFEIMVTKYQLPNTINQLDGSLRGTEGAKQALGIRPKVSDTNNSSLFRNSAKRTRALLKIQDGCNNFCAYCIVPHLRGREVSTNAEDVIAEAKKLEELGYKELVLSGVNVGRYAQTIPASKTNNVNLAKLVEKLLNSTNFPRIRLSSINPQDVTEEMLVLWAKEPRLCKHFHLSLQSGSNKVLNNMGRPYNREDYLDLCKKIVQLMPTCAITTDVIVGFPGEAEQDFKDTLELVKRAKLAKLHVFRYSKRKGTRAAEFSEQVSDSIKKERSEKLIKIGKELEKEFKEQFIGQEVEALFEEQKNGFWHGLTDNYIRVKCKINEDLENQFNKIVLKKENLA